MESRCFTASDGIEIQAWKSCPENPVGVLQLIHGSLEHAMRYGEFIRFMNEKGFAVYIMDLRGHGRTAEKSGTLNIFSQKEKGWERAIEDLEIQRQHIREDYPELPVYLMGHSMGSFLARNLAGRMNPSYQGLILSGTGRANPFVTYGGIILAKLFKLFSRNKPNALLHKLVYGMLNDQIPNPRTDYDFLSRDEKVVDAYIADPWCGRLITPEYGHELASGVLTINRSGCYRQTPDSLPVLLFSGEMDPVGGPGGSYVREVAEMYRKHGTRDVEVRFYRDSRHETLNELTRDDVYRDVHEWMTERQTRIS